MRLFRRQLSIRNSAIAPLLCALALAGCEEGLSGVTPDMPAPTGDTVETVEVDVIAPEAFSITDKALWDGRPTFGGVWIAYPDIEKPERVRIRNDATGKEVIGALYKRERDFPGPKIELSADAAAALGVLAGTPVELTIVALRRKTVEVVVEAREPDMSTPLRRPVPEQAEAPAAAEEPVEEPVAVVAPKIEIPAVVVPPVVVPAPTPIIATDIEETALPPASSAPEASDGPGTYVQVATLQSKSRADAVVAKLITAGLDAEIRERQAGGKTLYRIIVGPAETPEALEIMMGVVNELGYKDVIVLG
jgi:cell division septation protein DedD